ncbi:MAG TPA: hypothetical protein VH370_09245 [Humisphaera sp.]|jgi:hypothetical protein|nr:hypothetical protein [Humisphaera sp.]
MAGKGETMQARPFARCDNMLNVKRLRHIVWNASVAVSLLLFVAACWLWIASLARNDAAGWAGWRDQKAGVWCGWGADSRRHQLILYYFTSAYRFQNPSHVAGDDATLRPGFFHELMRPGRPGLAFHWGPPPVADLGIRSVSAPWVKLYLVAMPYWLLAALFGGPPTYAGIGWLLRRRRKVQARGFAPLAATTS